MDMVILIVVGLFVFFGACRGIVTELVRIILYLFSVFLGYKFAPCFEPVFSSFCKQEVIVSSLAAITSIFLFSFALIGVSKLLMKKRHFGTVDSLLGGLFSLLKCTFCIVFACFILTFLAPNFIQKSQVLTKTSFVIQNQMGRFVEKDEKSEKEASEKDEELKPDDEEKPQKEVSEEKEDSEKEESEEEEEEGYSPEEFKKNFFILCDEVTLKTKEGEKTLFLIISEKIQEKLNKRGEILPIEEVQRRLKESLKISGEKITKEIKASQEKGLKALEEKVQEEMPTLPSLNDMEK